MNIHGLIDILGVSIGAVAYQKIRYFSRDMQSKTIEELIGEILIELPKISGEGYYKIEVEYLGQKQNAGYRIEQWKGSEYPTIIYHHGAAEGSYDFSFNRILKKNKTEIPANLIAIQALFNHSNAEFFKNIAYFSKYTLMLAASVLIIEGLISELRKLGKEKITVTGISLGGFVTNLHFAHFNSADIYKPLLAGTRMGEVFFDSAYAKITDDKAKKESEKLKAILNIEGLFMKREQNKLFPLNAKFDRIVKYDNQSKAYRAENLKTIPYGHATGALQFGALRRFILEGINE